jgi:glutathione S-transferase
MTAQGTLRYVELAEARAAPGVRMLGVGALPSPWTEAAKGIFHVKEIPVLCVRHKRGDPEQAAWAGVPNAPAVFYDDDPPRTGWAEILQLAERLGGRVSLVPSDPAQRVQLFGLAHEICGEDGLQWNGRLIMLHGSMTSNGARSFPLRVAGYLASSYGYAPDRIERAHRRVREIFGLLDTTLAASRAAGHGYLLGDQLTALDIYLATVLTPIVGVTPEECPGMVEVVRPAFDYLGEQVGAELPPALAEHRRCIYREHLPWPIAL